MATLVTGSFNFQSSDDATYRLWLQHVKDVLDTVNPSMLAQTDDTGQVDIPTAIRPTTSGRPHYLIYKFDDGVGLPIYIRINMGSSGTSAGMTGMTFKFGTGTNGAGTLTGLVSADSTAPNANSAMGGIGISLACCKAGSLSVMIGQRDAWGGCMRGAFTINRFVDDAGEPTNEGFSWRAWGNYASTQFPNAGSVIFAGSPIYPNGGTWNYTGNGIPQDSINPYGLTTASFAGSVQPSPVFTRDPTLRQENLGRVWRGDVALNTEMSVAMVGSTPRNYRSLGMWADASLTYEYVVPWE